MTLPFLLLTPLGREDPTVRATLEQHGVRPWEVRQVDDYPSAASELYARAPVTAQKTALRRAYEQAWRARATAVAAEAWMLDAASFAAAWLIKPVLRARWPAELIASPAGTLVLRAFHLPDPEDVEREWRVLAMRCGPGLTG